jgi:hypothetical protein
MRIRNYITPLLVAATAAVSIASAPTAAAANQVCNGSGSGVICQSPGNVQINNYPPNTGYYGDYPYYLGDYGGYDHSGSYGSGGHSGGGFGSGGFGSGGHSGGGFGGGGGGGFGGGGFGGGGGGGGGGHR